MLPSRVEVDGACGHKAGVARKSRPAAEGMDARNGSTERRAPLVRGGARRFLAESDGMEANGQPEASTHEPAKVLATLDGFDDLHHVLRRRADELQLARLTIDQAAGLTRGHAAKLLAPVPIKRASLETLFFLAPALGLRLAVVEDAEALAQIKQRYPEREICVGMRAVTRRNGRHARKNNEVSLRHMRRIARAGGDARARALTRAQRSASARKAAKARWRKPRVVEIIRQPDRPPKGA